MTLPISDWIFYLEGLTYSAILCNAISPIHSNMSELSVFVNGKRHLGGKVGFGTVSLAIPHQKHILSVYFYRI